MRSIIKYLVYTLWCFIFIVKRVEPMNGEIPDARSREHGSRHLRTYTPEGESIKGEIEIPITQEHASRHIRTYTPEVTLEFTDPPMMAKPKSSRKKKKVVKKRKKIKRQKKNKKKNSTTTSRTFTKIIDPYDSIDASVSAEHHKRHPVNIVVHIKMNEK